MSLIKTIRVDIDGTICKMQGLDYSSAVPIPERIAVVNSWYDAGHTIIYWTARGALSGTDWLPLTKDQLLKWGCKYHELDMNKPLFDEFYDNRAFNADCVCKLDTGLKLIYDGKDITAQALSFLQSEWESLNAITSIQDE